MHTTKIPPPVARKILESLRNIFIDGSPADKVLQFQLRSDKRFGSRDRRTLAEHTYEMVRWWRRIVEASGIPWADAILEPEKIRTYENHFGQWLSNWLSLRDAGCDGLPPPQSEFALRWQSVAAKRAVRESVPDWLDLKGASELGDRWDGILMQLNQQAPVFLRANELLASPGEVQAALISEGFGLEKLENAVLQLHQRANVFQSPSFQRGFFEMQDRHSQRIVPFLDIEPGQRVIDACAGAGGKSLHIAALMKNKGQILALDIHEKKLDELRRRARRARVDIVEVRPIVSTKVIKRLKETADRVLLDVPCSGIGVLRRNPDKKWKLKSQDCERLVTVQMDILQNYVQMAKPGGLIVYASCSVLPSENQQRVEEFLSQNKAYELLDEMVLPPDSGDGFYAAKLLKKLP